MAQKGTEVINRYEISVFLSFCCPRGIPLPPRVISRCSWATVLSPGPSHCPLGHPHCPRVIPLPPMVIPYYPLVPSPTVSQGYPTAPEPFHCPRAIPLPPRAIPHCLTGSSHCSQGHATAPRVIPLSLGHPPLTPRAIPHCPPGSRWDLGQSQDRKLTILTWDVDTPFSTLAIAPNAVP